MVFIVKNKSGKLGAQKFGKIIAFVPLDKFYDYLNYMEEDAIWCLFKINEFISNNMEEK